MMRTLLLTVSLVIGCTILPSAGIAQSDLTLPLLRKSLWRVSLLNFVKPGFSHELRVAPKVSMLSVSTLRTDYTSQREPGKPAIYYRSLVAQASLSTRYCYNLNRRLIAGKDIRYNSGNYLSLGVYYTSPIMAHWGEPSLYTSTYPQGLGNTVNARLLDLLQRCKFAL